MTSARPEPRRPARGRRRRSRRTRLRSKPTRSILLTATTTWRMPSRCASAAWRRVCGSSDAVVHARGVDQDHGGVGGAGAGHHVAGVLLVARRVGDDELALRGREVAVGDVDRDALLALGLEAVGEQRQVDRVAPRRRARSQRAPARRAGRRGCSCVSYSSRPISVLLPSSTLPAVMKRSTPRSRRAAASGQSRAFIRNILRACAAPSRPRRSGRPCAWRRAR